MVKKNYVAPATNESRTKLRTGLLAGSTGGVVMGGDGNGTITTKPGRGEEAGTTPDGDIEDARRRGRASLD